MTRRRLYVVGVEPYVQTKPEAPAGRIVWEIGRLRDACLLLAGDRPYREYPADWVLGSLRDAGLRIVTARHFPIRYRARFINSQLDMCRWSLPHFADRWTAAAIEAQIEDLRRRALALSEAEGGLRHWADYVIVADV